MSKRIFGDEDTIRRIKNAKPGDPSVYVNMEAIEQLPDDMEASMAEVPYDREADFTNVGTDNKPSWYPKTQLMYNIADKRGIYGTEKVITEPVYEEVNISEMEMSPVPVVCKKKVGFMIQKQGAVMADDGTMRTSGYRTGIFNAWEECTKLWAAEEKWTEGYSKPNKYENKYDTKWKRRSHFQELLDKAAGMADTTAWLKCIRELAGLKTGYTTEDLKEGKFYFAKIRRSELVRKAETAARLTGLSRGANTQTAAKALFGESDTMRIGLQELAAQEIEPDPFLEASAETVIIEAEVVPQKSTRDILITVMEHYQAESLLPKNMITFTENILTWLHKTDDAEKKTDLWNKAIDRLRKIEETIPEKARVTHGLYK